MVTDFANRAEQSKSRLKIIVRFEQIRQCANRISEAVAAA